MTRIITAVAIAAFLAGATIAAQSVPEISFTATDLLRTPTEGPFVGEVAGVGANSRGQIFVYTRTGRRFFDADAAAWLAPPKPDLSGLVRLCRLKK